MFHIRPMMIAAAACVAFPAAGRAQDVQSITPEATSDLVEAEMANLAPGSGGVQTDNDQIVGAVQDVSTGVVQDVSTGVAPDLSTGTVQDISTGVVQDVSTTAFPSGSQVQGVVVEQPSDVEGETTVAAPTATVAGSPTG